MDSGIWLKAFKLMLMSRSIDDSCKKFLSEGGEVPNYHSGTGQEAMSVGIGLAAQPGDYLLFTYRDFGMLLAKGISAVELIGDLLLKSAGTTKGHGGIMHVSAPEKGVVGRNSVFGSRFGIGIGLALASKFLKEDRIVLCPFGEAEGGRGPLYEALNIAILGRLPIVFMAENNGYSISSRTTDIYAAGNMSGMFKGAPLPTSIVDGNDVEAVYNATVEASQHCRAGLGPVFLEFMTYRIDPHIPADTQYTYRTSEEVEKRTAEEPISRCKDRMIADGFALDDLAILESSIAADIGLAFTEAFDSSEPELGSMYEYLYYPQGSWPASSRRKS